MRRDAGDTLVEVLVATAILAMAVVGGLGIMNFGFGVVLNAIERTEVQAGVSSQLSIIQYSRDAYVRANRNGLAPGGASVWQKILDNVTIDYQPNVCTSTGAPATNSGRKPFYVNEDGATYTPVYTSGTPPAAQSAPKAGDGLWVEAVRPTGANYVDFYVKACWQPAAGTNNQESRSTMRLYAP